MADIIPIKRAKDVAVNETIQDINSELEKGPVQIVALIIHTDGGICEIFPNVVLDRFRTSGALLKMALTLLMSDGEET